ncbi:MAG: hypothetical protein WDN67_03645 [Candidatus Moraniibacteriota bacterium]
MHWILPAIFGYFCLGFSQLLDKYLLAGKRIPEPAVYAFYVALFSLFSLFFSPFGFGAAPLRLIFLFLFAGVLFVYGLLAFYYAVRDYELSRIAPLQGLIISVTVIIIGLSFPQLFGEFTATLPVFLSLALFVIGGILVSYDLPFKKGDHLPVSVFLSGVAIGLYVLILKYAYTETTFVNGLIWSRLGIFAGGLSLLLYLPFRKQITAGWHRKKRWHIVRKKRSSLTAALFVTNKIIAGSGTFLLLYAIDQGSAAFVQALNGIQYVFVMVLALAFALKFPKIYAEKLHF